MGNVQYREGSKLGGFNVFCQCRNELYNIKVFNESVPSPEILPDRMFKTNFWGKSEPNVFFSEQIVQNQTNHGRKFKKIVIIDLNKLNVKFKILFENQTEHRYYFKRGKFKIAYIKIIEC